MKDFIIGLIRSAIFRHSSHGGSTQLFNPNDHLLVGIEK